jgi:hypothetical protein
MEAVGLWALHGDGTLVASFPLALPAEAGHTSQGIRAAPTLADLDGNCQTDILASSLGGNLYAWSTPALANGTAPWPTGRHDLARTASAPPAAHASATVAQTAADYTVYLPMVRTRSSSGC